MLNGTDLIGSRVDIDGQLGTLRFHGSIPSLSSASTTIWYGIEWDEEFRGKHSGTHNGISYFTTKRPNSASFVKPSSKVKFGRPYLEAVQSKYIPHHEEELINMGDWGGKVVEAVGWEKVKRKQKTLSWLHDINVAGMQISGVGNNYSDEDITESSKNLVELDLSRNLFRRISDVGDLTKCMSKLEVLRLNWCRLDLDIDKLHNDAFSNLKVLVLNGVNWAWKEVQLLCRSLTVLEDLSFGFQPFLSQLMEDNDTTSSHNQKNVFKMLKALNLESNLLSDWKDITNALGYLPGLESLVLTNNPISEIDIQQTTFQTLKSITLSNTKISTWTSLNTLNALPSLQDLKIRRVPLLESIPDKARVLLLARIGSLTSLNGSRITPADRQDAELYYVNHFCPLDLLNPEFNALHPRYKSLIDSYGISPPDPNCIKSTNSSTLKDRLIAVKLEYSGKIIEKRVPGTMLMRNFKSFVGKLLGCKNVISMRLELVCHSDGRIVVMDDDLRDVGFFGMEGGDTIRVSKRVE